MASSMVSGYKGSGWTILVSGRFAMGLTYVARQENGGKNGPFRRRMGRSWLVCGSLTLTLLGALPITLLSGFGTAAQAQQGDVYSASGITVDLTRDIPPFREQALLKGHRQGVQ